MNKRYTNTALSLALASTLFMTGCGGGGGGSTSPTVTPTTFTTQATVTDGYIQGATCTVTNLATNTPLTGTYITSATGTVSFNGDKSGALYKIVCTGGVDTATNEQFTGQLEKITTEDDTSAEVTLLSTLVTQMVEANTTVTSISKALITQKTSELATALGISADTINANPYKKIESGSSDTNDTKAIKAIQALHQGAVVYAKAGKSYSGFLQTFAQNLPVSESNVTAIIIGNFSETNATLKTLLSNVANSIESVQTVTNASTFQQSVEEAMAATKQDLNQQPSTIAAHPADYSISIGGVDYNVSYDGNITSVISYMASENNLSKFSVAIPNVDKLIALNQPAANYFVKVEIADNASPKRFSAEVQVSLANDYVVSVKDTQYKIKFTAVKSDNTSYSAEPNFASVALNNVLSTTSKMLNIDVKAMVDEAKQVADLQNYSFDSLIMAGDFNLTLTTNIGLLRNTQKSGDLFKINGRIQVQ